MATTILIPTPLRSLTGKRDSVEVEGNTVGELLQNLAETYPSLRKHLFGGKGKATPRVNVLLNDEDVRFLEKESTQVTSNDTISLSLPETTT